MATSSQMEQAKQHLRQGRCAEAISLLQELLQDNDTDILLHDAIGSAYFLAGDNERAEHHFKRITRLTVNAGKAMINLGAVYNRRGLYQKAVETIRRGLQFEKRSVEGFYNLGLAHRRLNQGAMATHAFKEALRLDPRFAEAHAQLGTVYLDQGLPEQAAHQFREALKIRPDFDRAREGLSAAERAGVLAKQAISPFGRLVDTTVGQHATDDSLRPLSESERQLDRARLHELSRSIENLAREWTTVVKDELSVSLTHLDKRLAISGNEYLIEETLQEFRGALAKAEKSRQRLRRKVLELVAHEELQHSPLVDGEPRPRAIGEPPT